ncbi:MAG: flagellar biosynthesis protein FlhB [Candidatus Competibacteraceae bacterium]|nr:flagellar biosynthesis protein FlhB [Candidatus Competibacteraceae bacterium]
MADNTDGQERTEEATPRKLKQAADEGQIARSRELATFGMLLGGAGSLLLFGPPMARGLAQQMRTFFAQDPRLIRDPTAIPGVLVQAMVDMLLILAPLLGVLTLVAVVAPLGLGGWSFSTKALIPKPAKLNPLSGIKRMFSAKSLMELLKALAKFTVVGVVAVMLLKSQAPALLGLATEPLLPALAHAAWLIGWMFLLLTLPTLLIALVDVPFQLYSHNKQLKMTKQEVKDEMKDTEGKPEVKGRIRRLQQEMAQRRMMEQVPSADVVVTNPTHFAVALRYDPATMDAPVMVAKGAELVALRIRSLAEQHHIPRVESPLLARALYYNGDLDRPIPTALYRAVAQVLSHVFELRSGSHLADKPIPMTDVPVPPELRVD